MSLKLENVSYIYEKGTSQETAAIKNVDLEINKGEFVAIIGHTGSGKSTLIQHFNGLEKPTEGKVLYDGKDIFDKDFDLRKLRCKVGLVFQYPEHQLFEATVLKDVCFGPKNEGLSNEDAWIRAKEALKLVGIGEEMYEKSPFEMSGGQKRRVAIAGTLAMNPEILVLDEPTAGLDPEGRDKILQCISDLRENRGIGVVLVSHSMEDVARLVDRIIVMHKGKVAMTGTPREIFSHPMELEQMGLAAPQVSYVFAKLKEKGYDVPTDIYTVEEARDALLKLVKQVKA